MRHNDVVAFEDEMMKKSGVIKKILDCESSLFVLFIGIKTVVTV